MPYIPLTVAKEYGSNPVCKDVGTLNFAITNYIIDDWLQNTRYDTIHEIRKKFFINPLQEPRVKGLKAGTNYTDDDLKAASMNAFDEFYRRVAARYEDQKKKAPSNVDPYIERAVLWKEENMSRW